eukprot:CAMPEP_0177541246 /NCGR_PEP_ID=MMETSP0369-20130122/60069_1 /TAXON_ID=447022 ORGANISM="Scrippsiella hangoei-like, Strain SHHI-4" /NCGR_SAMPLE_ID=MMETSP0369 /ASSEMBLY_ACC=CAM_ASM_000364 /LENGTH=52 /DNA_ID=CAMNT_0019024633 /DNA_START=34 /DNA_END=189 /DNA_ORIENTATION=+
MANKVASKNPHGKEGIGDDFQSALWHVTAPIFHELGICAQQFAYDCGGINFR